MTYAPTREDLFFARSIVALDNWHNGPQTLTIHHDNAAHTSGRIETEGADEDQLERYAAIFAPLGYSVFQSVPSCPVRL